MIITAMPTYKIVLMAVFNLGVGLLRRNNAKTYKVGSDIKAKSE
jgi:hypothetical protein